MALKSLNRIRFPYRACLILFIPFLLTCKSKNNSEFFEISIIWKDQKPVAVSIPKNQLPSIKHKPTGEQLSLHVAGHPESPVLGEWASEDSVIIFYPLVAFTTGTIYELYKEGQFLASFQIEAIELDTSSVTRIFPSSDTVPENLLKVYIEFSMPMSEGEALKNIRVVELASGDTMDGTFLDLQPELWNEDNTLLTLWLDPGRIKRGLIPNREMGVPLREGHRYKILINKNWRGSNGLPMAQSISKEFYVGTNDRHSPVPESWKLTIPDAGTGLGLKVEFGEPLDAILAIEAIRILNAEGVIVAGKEDLGEKERSYLFTPEQAWSTGDYGLQIETRLEDLAGNNLNRLFDEDIKKRQEDASERNVIELPFRVE